MKTTLVATFIQISIRALVVAVLVPRVGLNGAVRIVAPQHVCDGFRKLLLEQLEE